MTISNIEISGYRGFKHKGRIEFATPNGNPGSGITIITGPNNSGKSSILEAVRARNGQQSVSFTAGTRNPDLEFVEIQYNINGKTELLKSTSKGSSETIRDNVDTNYNIYVLPSRRSFAPYFFKGESNRRDYLFGSSLPPQRASTITNFEQRLFNALRNPGKFNLMIGEVIGFIPEWTIDQSDQGNYFLKFFNGSKSHSSDGMGEGIVSIFAIVDSLYDSNPGEAIFIDEPELSLHPALQKRLSSLLIRLSSDRQIIIATHSPYFIDPRALLAGGQLLRVSTGSEGTKIYQLSNESIASINRLSSGNRYNPHVFGLDARELFFQEDGIILTEGQEDVLLYPKLAELLGVPIAGDFFGWGVGGAGNMKHLCMILKDLGFNKVAGLLDGDKADVEVKLRREFPGFFFACIPAKDIRTKEARKAVEATKGIFNEEFEVRPEYEHGTKKIISELSSYINGRD